MSDRYLAWVYQDERDPHPALDRVEPTAHIKWCFTHNQEVKKGKRACEYRLIWERDIPSSQIGECDMADALIVRMGEENET